MICYAKIRESFPHQAKEVRNYKTHTGLGILNSKTELYIESAKVYEDNDKNLWVQSAMGTSYYLLYDNRYHATVIDIFPTAYAEVTSDCKAGLGLYQAHDFSSKELLRKDVEELYEITSDFFVDERGNIWVYSVNVYKDEKGFHKVDGWIPYKTKRNNFANLLIHGRYNVVTTGGLLDPEKVKSFREYIATTQMKDFYKYSEPLQMFGSAQIGNGKTVKVSATSDFTQIRPTNPNKNGTVSGTGSGRKFYPYSGRNKTIGVDNANKKAIVQNKASFPAYKGIRDNGLRDYNYFMNYDKDKINDDLDELQKHLNYYSLDYTEMYRKIVSQYNRFKIANPADILSRGFAHVFFTRPDCNIFKDNKGQEPVSKVEADPNFKYALCNKRELLYQLAQVSNSATGNKIWGWLLSNKALSFSLSDESIGYDKYGTSYRKNAIAFGRTNEESKAAGEFSIDFQDTRELDIFHIHKLWTDYISNVYVGKWYPKNNYLWEKIIDYACSVYYIITAEDGETILFWSKYYGCFPVNVPSSSYSWSAGEPITSQKLSLSYQYSYKEDFNPLSLVELNINTGVTSSNGKYVPTFNPNLGTVGNTWVGAPFIETIKDSGTDQYTLKLRFMKGE